MLMYWSEGRPVCRCESDTKRPARFTMKSNKATPTPFKLPTPLLSTTLVPPSHRILDRSAAARAVTDNTIKLLSVSHIPSHIERYSLHRASLSRRHRRSLTIAHPTTTTLTIQTSLPTGDHSLLSFLLSSLPVPSSFPSLLPPRWLLESAAAMRARAIWRAI